MLLVDSYQPILDREPGYEKVPKHPLTFKYTRRCTLGMEVMV
jgi:hypothetical protein